ncbi:hypothetical protein R6Q59_016725 [Mikania micrantha]|uniref:C2H2-type domain-containing protein n=1 Tax=Mikania micrantha TaxID=192012 RepID=A0A5N6M8A6_9ASTR|nr:hypothetical protein E3N88_37113 [Mikania micrantha]
MEKNRCNLCLKSFANGRALGGHMRSHMRNLHVNPNPKPPPQPPPHSPSSSSDEITSDLSRNSTVRERSKRVGGQQHFHGINRYKNQNQFQYMKKSTTDESLISDASPEEVVAYCLLMLSRDKWTDEQEEEENDDESESDSDRELIKAKRSPTRDNYRCEACNKVFRSYQALGGHISSHKKIKLNHQFHHNSNQQRINVSFEDKIYECHVCFKVFASGQALGGHKRSHATAKQAVKQSINLIDLNLPAPSDVEDEFSQIVDSDVEIGELQ